MLEAGQLRSNVLNLVDRVVDPAQLIARLEQQIELLLQIGLADLYTRVQFQIEARCLGLTSRRDSNLIMTGDRDRTARTTAIFPKVVTWHVTRLFIAQVPNESVQACLWFQLLLRFLVVGIERFLGRVVVGARKFPNNSSGGVENLDLGFGVAFRRLFQEVTNRRASRRISPRPFGRMPFAARPRLNPVGGLRRVQKSIFLNDVITILTKRRDIVENPECAAG